MIPQTVCFDETASPLPQPDFEWYVVGPRTAVTQANEITASGSKVLIKLQPVVWRPNGVSYMGATWDRILSGLPYLESPTLDLPGDGMEGSKILDFSKAAVQNLWSVVVQLCQQRGAVGVLFDYGSTDIQGSPPGWKEGYALYRQRVRDSGLRIWNATNKPQPSGPCMFESISPTGSDYGWPPNYRQIRAAGGGSMYLIQNDDVKHRRIICGIALENGALVNYRPRFAEDRWANSLPPELVF